jgi:hypothetical protein
MDMGFAPGGRMRQEIYDDPYGLDAWDQRHLGRCFVTIANSTAWEAISGERPPTEPPSAKLYTAAGLPWFEYYGADAKAPWVLTRSATPPADLISARLFRTLRSVAMQFHSHLSDDERDQIAILRAAGRSMGAIARALGRAKTTICRELQRNALPSGGYSPLHAAGAYQLRRRREALLDIDRTSDREIQEIVLTTNLTPRKCLGFKTPFQALLAEIGKDVQIRFS